MSSFVVYLTGAETEADVTTANISNTLSGTTAASITDTWNTASSQSGTPDVTIEIDWSKHNFMDYMQLRWDPNDEDAIGNADTDANGDEHKVEYIINKGYDTTNSNSRGFFDYGYSSNANVNPVTQGLNTLALDTSTLNNASLITTLKNTHGVNDNGVTDAERHPLLVYLTTLASEIFGHAGTLELISNEKTIADEVTEGGAEIATKLNNLINNQNQNPLSPNYIVGKLLTGIIGQHLGSALYTRFQNHIEVYKMANGVFTKYDPKLGGGRYYDVISDYNGTADANGNLVKADNLPHDLFNFGFRVGDTIRIRLNLVTDDNDNVVFSAVDANGDAEDRVHASKLYEFKVNLIDDILELNSGSSDTAKTTNEDTNTTGTIAVRYVRTPDLDLLGSGAGENDSKLYSFSISSQPTNGTASINNQGVWTYSPDPNYNSNVAATDSFTVLVKDKYGGQLASPLAGHTVSQVVTMTVTPVNDAPVANALSGLTVNEDNSLAIQLTSSDVDNSVSGESQTFVYSIVQNGSIGNAVITNSATGAVTYTPQANKYGSDSFTFKVTDSQGGVSNTATVSLTVISVNDRPVASAQSLDVDEDSPGLEILLGGADVDNSVMNAGQAFTYAISSNPSNGTLLNFNASTGVVTYKPDANYFGADSFAFTITDDAAGSSDANLTSLPATISITVNSVNDVPNATAQSVAVTEDVAKLIQLAGTDVANEGQTLSFAIVSQPSNGSLSLDANFSSNGQVTYTPNNHYYGSDSFTFKVNDSEADSAAATVSISVSSVNDKPVANAQSVAVTEDVAKLIELGGSDVDNSVMSAGQALTFAIASQPSNGSLSLDANFSSNGKVTYTPNANYNGADSFTFTITDDAAGSSDANLTSDAATISLSIAAVNDAPVAAADQSGTVNEDNTLSITLSAASDIDISRGENQTLSYSISSNPSNGTLDVTGLANNGRNLTYTPDTNWNGTDSFQYQVSDGNGGTDSATVTVTVTAVNDAPVAAADQTININEDSGVLSITLSAASDVDNSVTNEGQALSYAIVGTIPATSGVLNTAGLANNGRSLTFTPANNFNGQVQFTYRVSDDQNPALSDTGIVTINVAAVNDAPVAAANQSFSINEDSSALSITLSAASDIDISRGESQSLSYSITDQPDNGTLDTAGLANNGRGVTYTPNANFYGSDSFTYQVSDGNGGTDTAVVNITIASVNDAPVAPDLSVTTNEDTALLISLPAAQDVDNSVMNAGQTFTYQFVSGQGTSNGSLTPDANFASNGKVTYSPNADFNGSDEFEYTVKDSANSVSASGTVTITVTAVDDAPVTEDATYSVNEDNNLQIQLSTTSSDVDGDSLTYAIVSGISADKGVLTLANAATGQVIYAPKLNFNGQVQFTYRVTANSVVSNTSTITINVAAVNDAPVAAADQSVSVVEDTVTNFIVGAASDVDSQNLTYSVDTNVPTAAGSVSLVSGSTFKYQPALNFNGQTSFIYQVSDGALTDTATVTLNVSAVNDAPVASAASYTYSEDSGAQNITLAASDAEGSSLTFSIVSNPSKGSLTLDSDFSSNGKVVYTPNANAEGADNFTFKVNDGTVDSVAATISIDLTGVNDAPVASAASYTYNEDSGAKTITLGASDPDVGATLTYSIVSNPSKGSLNISGLNNNGNTVVYTPNADAEGADSFTFKVNDGTVDSAAATISITLTPVADAPTANGASYTYNEDAGAKTITLGASDPDVGATLTYSIVSNPSKGSLNISGLNNNGNTVVYTPNADANGADSFTFKVNDGSSDSNTATINITLTPVNDAPQFQSADNLAVSATEDSSKLITLNTGVASVTDTEGDSLTYSIVTNPTNGSLNVADLNSSDNDGPRVTYTPNANYNGSDSFVFRVDDSNGGTADKTVDITIAAQPDDATGAPTVTTKTSGGAASGKYFTGETYQIDTSAIQDVDTSDALTFSYSTTFLKYDDSLAIPDWVADSSIAAITTASFTLLQAHEFRRLVTVVTQTNGGNKSWTLTGTTMVINSSKIVQDADSQNISGSEYTVNDFQGNYSSSGLSNVELSTLSDYITGNWSGSIPNGLSVSINAVSNNTNLITTTNSTTSSMLQFLPTAVEDANGNTTITVSVTIDNVVRKSLTYNVSITKLDSVNDAIGVSSLTVDSLTNPTSLTIVFDKSNMLDNVNTYYYQLLHYDSANAVESQLFSDTGNIRNTSSDSVTINLTSDDDRADIIAAIQACGTVTDDYLEVRVIAVDEHNNWITSSQEYESTYDDQFEAMNDNNAYVSDSFL